MFKKPPTENMKTNTKTSQEKSDHEQFLDIKLVIEALSQCSEIKDKIYVLLRDYANAKVTKNRAERKKIEAIMRTTYANIIALSDSVTEITDDYFNTVNESATKQPPQKSFRK